MTTLELLSHLKKSGVKLWVEGDQLHSNAAAGLLSAQLCRLLSERADEIVAFLREAQGVTRSTLPPLSPVSRDQELPLSFAQQRLWFLDQLEPGGFAYNIPVGLRISGPLNPRALERSLNEIVKRHEILRTTFPLVRGKPVQKIAPYQPFSIPISAVETMAGQERDSQVRQMLIQEARHAFDLAMGPLLRAKLWRLDAAEHVLLLNLHHIISDLWSIGILLQEFARFYEAFSQGTAPSLPGMPVQYADFAHWQRSWL